MFEDLLTAGILGLAGGITPGPIILLAFSEILQSPQEGLKNASAYLIVTSLTEMLIGLFLVTTSRWLPIPQWIIHLVSLAGLGLMTVMILQIFRIREWKSEGKAPRIQKRKILALMLLNGPLWTFWLTVCLPVALRLGSKMPLGQYAFVLIFETAMLGGLTAMLLGFHSFRRFFQEPKLVKKLFFILGCLLTLIALRMAFLEVSWFLPNIF